MKLDFSEIQEVEKLIELYVFEDYFYLLENNAFTLRGNSTDYYIFINQFFIKNNINDDVKKLLIKKLVNHNGNWRHNFLNGMYESLKGTSAIVENKNTSITENTKKIPEKFYALYHWLLIDIGKAKIFEKNQEDKYKKTEIKNFAKNAYSITGEVFYRNFISIDFTNKNSIPRSFGKEYKNKLIQISNNDADVISALKNYPN